MQGDPAGRRRHQPGVPPRRQQTAGRMGRRGVMSVDTEPAVIPNLGTWSDLTGDDCPAGGQHTWRLMTPWSEGPGADYITTGWACDECGAAAPPDDDTDPPIPPDVWD